MNTEIYNRVIKCIAEVDKVNGVNFIHQIHQNIEKYRYPAINLFFHRDLVYQLEKEFNISLSYFKFSKNQTIEDIVNTIEKLLK